MKSIRFTLLGIALTGVIGWSFLPTPTLAKETRDFSEHPEAPIAGVVERRAGAVFAVRVTGHGRAVLDMGEKIHDGDRILTETGKVHVRFRDGTFAELGENSTMTVERVFQRKKAPLEGHIILNREDESVYRFENGLLRMTPVEIGAFQAYTVKTDVAVIEVQEPSDFIIAHMTKSDSDGEITNDQYDLRVLSGKVTFMNIVTNETQELKAGFSAIFKPNGVFHAQQKLSEQEISFLKKRTGI